MKMPDFKGFGRDSGVMTNAFERANTSYRMDTRVNILANIGLIGRVGQHR